MGQKLLMEKQVQRLLCLLLLLLSLLLLLLLLLLLIKSIYIIQNVRSKINIGIIRGKADILSEVRQLLFIMRQKGRVIDRDENVLNISLLDSILNGNVLSFLDNSGIQVILRQDFISWWKDNTLGILTGQNSTSQSLLIE